MEKLYDKKVQGILTRAKTRWIKDGEKNSKYFIGLEKRNYLNKTISCLYKANGDKITNFNEILVEEKRFYSELYAKKNVNLNNEEICNNFFINNDSIPKLNEEMKQSCEGLISKEECEKAIKSMPNSKTPGTDGLPVEFYKIFWNEISDIVVESFNYSYNTKNLSISQKQGIITLLPKKDKDTRFLKNWRPISLLNTDYKIMTKCIASRLKEVLPHIIHPSQTGFMKDRYIGFNIRLIIDLIEYAENENKPGLIFSIDFEKAFDSVSWDYLDKCIDYFNFGDSFKQWVKLFINDISSCILNNGWSSGFFPLRRGVRQGCPLSPYLFLLCAEVFGIAFRNNININGIKVKDLEEKISQFADDTQLLLDGSIQSLNEAIIMLEVFETLSGMKVNFDKSEVIKLGCTKFDALQPLKPVKFTENSFKLLGIEIPINADYNTLIKLNYDTLLEKVKHILGQWSKRTLTLYGKTVIIESLILPQFTYQLSNLPSPNGKFLKEVDDLIFDFLWNKKRAKIKRSQMYLDYEEGGLGIPNIKVYSRSLKLRWVRFLIDDTFSSSWKQVFFKVNNKIGKFVFKSNIKPSDVKQIELKNEFWIDVLKSWAEIHYEYDANIDFRSKHPQCFLWCNSDIKIQNRIIYYNVWYEKGIEYIKDLLDENGIFLEFETFRTKYNLDANFLTYYGLISKLRNIVNRNGIVCNTDRQLNKILHVKSASKMFYKTLLNKINKHTERRCFEKWEETINSQFNWETIFGNIYKTTIDTKLRNFQFKLIHNILPDNKILKKMGIVDSDLCNFCNIERDSVIHYIWYCPSAQQYWNSVKTWLNTIFDIGLDLSLKNIIFGHQYVDNNMINNLINTILLIAKHYLHCCKWIKHLPSLEILKEKIKMREKIEKDIAFQIGKIDTHNKKWHSLQ